METSQIRLRTKDFRAIAEADIHINGITLVAGENGCGKSTLSKLLFHFYKTATSFEDNVSKYKVFVDLVENREVVLKTPKAGIGYRYGCPPA